MNPLTCFKANDIRGKLGYELNESIAYRIGRAYVQSLAAQTVVVGHDNRLSSPMLKQALINGLRDEGCHVIDIGLSGTEEIYFATNHLQTDGGIQITASHNPIDFNGMKLVKRHVQPINCDNGLNDIKKLAETADFMPTSFSGSLKQQNISQDYVAHILQMVDWRNFKPLKIVCNAGNGMAGHIIDIIEAIFCEHNIPVSFIKINHEVDGRFPNGIPNPLLPENREVTAQAVRKHQADIGIAWDGDFDRCFFFDHSGSFIESYYIVGLLAQTLLQNQAASKIIYDPRLTWNTEDIVQNAGGTAIISKTGHAFIKNSMRWENAVYGGEMSGHHYFRDFAYCDSGMIPWLLIVQLLSGSRQTLKQMVADRIRRFPCSGELNFSVANPAEILAQISQHYESHAKSTAKLDGFSADMGQWRFNIRLSNTEALVRLNAESRADPALLAEKTAELIGLIHLYSQNRQDI